MTATTVRTVRAADLLKGDVFSYSGTEVEVIEVTPLGSTLVEVRVHDDFVRSGERFLDYGVSETIAVSSGPSAEAPMTLAPAPRTTTATQRAREAVRLGKARSLPASASLVLYAAAAAQDEVTDGWSVPSVGSIATGAGLAVSTTTGHLRALAQRGLVRQSGLGWVVA